MTNRDPSLDSESIVTIEAFETLAEAQWARNILASSGICSLLPDEETNRLYNFFQGPVLGGVRLQVRSGDADSARAILKEVPYETVHPAHRTPYYARLRCPSCGSEALAAVPENETLKSPYELRCQDCDRRFDVSEEAYLSEDYPILPTRCPSCGTHDIHITEPPPGALSDSELDLDPGALQRQWLRCDGCAHEWVTPVIVKQGRERKKDGNSADEAGETAAPPLTCPKCRSPRIAQDLSADVVENLLFLYCESCRHAWTLNEAQGELPAIEETGPPAIDAGAVCPVPHRRECPSCGSHGGHPCPPPDWAGESRLLSALKRFGGKGWFLCGKCGNQWEE